MFKIVCLFSVLALAAAKPNIVAPLGFGIIPGLGNNVVPDAQVVPAVVGGLSPLVPAAIVADAALTSAALAPALALEAVKSVGSPEVLVGHASQLSGVQHLV